MKLFLVLITLVHADEQNRQIKLEDIERDNLVSEERAKIRDEGGLVAQHSQYLRPSSTVITQSPKFQQNNHEQETSSGGVTYAHQQDYEEQQPRQQYSQGGVQYATPPTAEYSQSQGKFMQLFTPLFIILLSIFFIFIQNIHHQHTHQFMRLIAHIPLHRVIH